MTCERQHHPFSTGLPLDELVELITYDQAREHIKRVLAYDQPSSST